MNKIYTLLSFLLIGSFASHAQEYVPFPESNAIWLTMHEHDVFPGNQYTYVGMKNSDTVINGMTYHKMYESLDDTILEESEYIGALRQDTAVRKVYFLDKAQTSEHVLYDFSLHVGDTMHFYSGVKSVVTAIDTITVNGQVRRFFKFYNGGNAVFTSSGWIEGIGNNYIGGLFGHPAMLTTCTCNTYAICFKKDNNWVYHNPNVTTIADCDAAPLGIPSVPKVQSIVNIFPNPITGISQLQVSGIGNNAQLCIYNVAGIKVKTLPVNGNIGITLNRNDYPAGIYSYRIVDEKGAAVAGKFVVQ